MSSSDEILCEEQLFCPLHCVCQSPLQATCSNLTQNLNSILNAIKYLRIIEPKKLEYNETNLNYKLTYLNLTKGKLQFENIDFKYFKNLKIVDLSDNLIENFSWKLFGEPKNIYYLNLNKNRLKIIKKIMFDKFENIFYIHLTENQLKAIYKNSFKNLKNIFYLNLDKNELEFVDGNIFSKKKLFTKINNSFRRK